MRSVILVAAAVMAFAGTAVGQTASPVTDALRDAMRTASAQLIVAAETMPPDRYGVRPSASEPTFGELVARATNVSIAYCARIAGRPPAAGFADESEPKDTLTAKLRGRLRECEEVLKGLTDAGLGETIRFNGPKSRAAVITGATTFWGEVRQQMVGAMRRAGVVPPTPCTGPGGEVHGGGPGCESGRNLCTSDRNPLTGSRVAILADAPYSIRSDGAGRYVPGDHNVFAAAAGTSAALLLADQFTAPSDRRAFLIDLDDPVPSQGGRRLGVVRADNNVVVVAQQRVGAANRLRLMSEIPVGASVPAPQISIEFRIDSAVYVLQAGPQPVGHCFSDGTAVHGNGTSIGTITRADSSTWVIELPPKSVARLFDVRNQYPHAVDKGLYFVSLKLTIEPRR